MLGSFPPELLVVFTATSLLRSEEPTLSCNQFSTGDDQSWDRCEFLAVWCVYRKVTAESPIRTLALLGVTSVLRDEAFPILASGDSSGTRNSAHTAPHSQS
jgi:hypothetical protein